MSGALEVLRVLAASGFAGGLTLFALAAVLPQARSSSEDAGRNGCAATAAGCAAALTALLLVA